MPSPPPSGCPIPGSIGCVSAVGPRDAPLLLIGEAAGHYEAFKGVPFIGDAGAMLDRLLGYAGIDRRSVRIANAVQCKPTGDWLVGAPWEQAALDHCSPQLQEVLNERHPVVVTLGATALRQVLDLKRARGKEPARVQDFHGAPLRDPLERSWVVPTFHPSHLQRGMQKLTKTVVFDLSVAKELAEGRWEFDQPRLVIDPPVEQFRAWVDGYLAALAQNPNLWLAVDVETPDKGKKGDEGELGQEDKSYEILYINLSYSREEGITVPWRGAYIPEVRRALAGQGTLGFWNCPTPDQRVLTADLSWVPAGSLKVGDSIVGFDEVASSNRRARRYRTATVTHAGRGEKTVYAIHLSDGAVVKVTGEHPWLLKPPVGEKRRRWQWVPTESLRVGWKVSRLFHTWDAGTTRAHGYLAGFFDGEGHLSWQRTTRTMTVGAAQKFGPTYDYVIDLLSGFNSPFKYREYKVKREKDKHIGQIHLRGRTADVARFLGEVRPMRLLNKFKPEALGSIQTRRDQDVYITKIECLGLTEIVTLSTSTSTYVLEGFGAHNSPYDVPRLRVQGVRVDQARVLDFMDAWHVLQSALPRGLGFVAPFYSKTGPWKHRGNLDGVYRAMDGVQTIRCAEGIAEDLQQEGMWEVFTRHCWEYDTYVLRPAERVGLGLNREELGKFSEELKGECARLAEELSRLVPEEVRPLAGPLKRRPEGEEGIVEKQEEVLVQVCSRCGATEVAKTHRCSDLKPVPRRAAEAAQAGGATQNLVVLETRSVARYYRREPFNPASWQQILAYIKWKGHKPGRAKKTGKESSDKKTLERLLKTGDPFYRMVLDHRQAGKMEGTYGSGILEKLDSQDRIHTTFTHVPSTLRLSSTGPNLQNLASHVKYAAGFRRCVEAKPGHLLMSFDKSGVEAVMVGWFSRDPNYIRLAKLGVHAFVQSHVLVQEKKIKEAADLSWSDCALREFFADLKKRYPGEYDKSKRCVHGYNYGLTEFGMAEYYPEVFPKRADAAKLIAIYTEVCPKLAGWHSEVLKAADQRKYLGGPGEHPFGYKHHFYSVIEYRRARGGWKEYQGEDAKRAKAFLPQSTAAGDIAEDALILFNQESPQYIGDLCEGDTPLRALIHDEFFFEVPEGQAGKLYERVQEVMTRVVPEMPCPPEWGLGDYLSIGVSAKVGRNWAPYNEDPKRGAINLQGMKAEGPENLAADDFYLEDEEEEEPE